VVKYQWIHFFNVTILVHQLAKQHLSKQHIVMQHLVKQHSVK
jgi:hypothetical protein